MTVKIGIIGCSGHIDYILSGIRELADARLCAIAPGCDKEDISQLMKNRTVAEAEPVVYDDYRKLLDKENVDVVGINPPYFLHAEICAEALRRGTAPFCEKPLALTMDSLDELRRVQQETGIPVGIMLAFRYKPMFFTARELVRSGIIGEPTVGYAQKSYKCGKRPWFYMKRETFGGIIPWVGIHAIDWFQWVSGRRYTAVIARQNNLHIPEYPEMEDHATALFELDNGGTAVMSFDFLRPAGAASHGDDRLRLVGSKGYIEIRWPELFEVVTADGPYEAPLQEPPSGLFADFVRSVIDKKHVCMIPTEETFKITEVALKTRDAADKGIRITL